MLGSAHTEGVGEVRDLARQGLLSATVASARGPYRLRLTGATYSIVWPIVYRGLTQKIELRRGHVVCAASVSHLAAECLDRFENDVEAVVDDVFRKAGTPIENLEGWIASRLVPATVDGHRRRRGRNGALQRPRVPAWLARALGADPWLIDLATQMLVWVGTTSTAGYELWPTETWAVRRCERLGGWSTYGEADVRADVRTVLRAMNQRPQWYQRYVEVPLGHKQAPVVASQSDGRGEALPLTPPDAPTEQERLLTELAETAIQLIQARLARAEPARTVVAEVLSTVFGGDPGVAEENAGRAYDDRLGRVLCDATELDRLVTRVVEIVGEAEPQHYDAGSNRCVEYGH